MMRMSAFSASSMSILTGQSCGKDPVEDEVDDRGVAHGNERFGEDIDALVERVQASVSIERARDVDRYTVDQQHAPPSR